LDEALLRQALARLVEAELLYQRGVPPQASYLFKHALIQEAAYQSLLKSTRQQFHQRIAQVLEARFPSLVATQAVIAHYALGTTSMWLGALPAARTHLEEGIARYTPDQRRALVFRIGQDPGVACRAYTALILWLLGYPEQALARLHDALALAHELSHPFNLAFARCVAAMVYHFRRDMLAVHEQAEAIIVLSTEQGFPFWAGMGTSLRGWALARQSQGEEGTAQIRQGCAARRATGSALGVLWFCILLAEASDRFAHTEDGLQALAEAHTLMEEHEERWWEAEVHRLRGVLLLRQTGMLQEEAETWL
jgi:predicted ATPase